MTGKPKLARRLKHEPTGNTPPEGAAKPVPLAEVEPLSTLKTGSLNNGSTPSKVHLLPAGTVTVDVPVRGAVSKRLKTSSMPKLLL